MPIVASVTKHAATWHHRTRWRPGSTPRCGAACTPHRGPTFVDVPLDAWGPTDVELPAPAPPGRGTWAVSGDARRARHGGAAPRADGRRRRLLGRAEEEVRAFAEAARLPVFANDMGRGVVPADHELAFSRARSLAFEEADLVLVAGTPLDFRLGFGSFGDAPVVHLVDATTCSRDTSSSPRRRSGDLRRDVRRGSPTMPARRERRRLDRDRCATRSGAAASAEEERLDSAASPDRPGTHLRRAAPSPRPRRGRHRRRRRLRLVCREVHRHVHAGLLPRTRPVRLSRQRDGLRARRGARPPRPPGRRLLRRRRDRLHASATSTRSCATSVNVTAVIGNNGIWGLEKHPMQMIFGYDVVAELRPGTRYDQVAEALGGHGELVQEPDEIGPALDRAFAHDRPLGGERPHRPRRRLPPLQQPRLNAPASPLVPFLAAVSGGAGCRRGRASSRRPLSAG